jgi:hypothetical protein
MLTTFDLWKGQGRRHNVSSHWKCKSPSFDFEIDKDRCRILYLSWPWHLPPCSLKRSFRTKKTHRRFMMLDWSPSVVYCIRTYTYCIQIVPWSYKPVWNTDHIVNNQLSQGGFGSKAGNACTLSCMGHFIAKNLLTGHIHDKKLIAYQSWHRNILFTKKRPLVVGRWAWSRCPR